MFETTKVSKWGNSLGLKLPKSICDSLQLSDGCPDEEIIKDGDTIIRSVKTNWNIESVVENMTIEDAKEQMISVTPIGKEQYWLDEI